MNYVKGQIWRKLVISKRDGENNDPGHFAVSETPTGLCSVMEAQLQRLSIASRSSPASGLFANNVAGGGGVVAGHHQHQVWSLTQFRPPDFFNTRNILDKKARLKSFKSPCSTQKVPYWTRPKHRLFTQEGTAISERRLIRMGKRSWICPLGKLMRFFCYRRPIKLELITCSLALLDPHQTTSSTTNNQQQPRRDVNYINVNQMPVAYASRAATKAASAAKQGT